MNATLHWRVGRICLTRIQEFQSNDKTRRIPPYHHRQVLFLGDLAAAGDPPERVDVDLVYLLEV